jgi:hypothetical protein
MNIFKYITSKLEFRKRNYIDWTGDFNDLFPKVEWKRKDWKIELEKDNNELPIEDCKYTIMLM